MQLKDIMTADVVTVKPETSIDAIASLLLERNISGVPVVDADRHVLGIVSEGDLLHRLSAPSRSRSWWLRLLSDERERAEEFIKDHGLCARDVMTREVVVVEENTAISEAARLLEGKRIKRLPVVRNGRLVGIVSRANLLQALATRSEHPAIAASDRDIREKLLAMLKQQGWVTHGSLNIIVNDGVVDLWGWVESEEERQALLVAAREVASSYQINDHLGFVPPYLQGT